ncbi:hypothetical protein [Frigidibacter sp. MR17.24]|uniref:hypothetical protein n=1 Tax=Frigidibacter sp. MR17.24 TaxID=3127345 RepID=UPI003012EA01
MPSPTRSRRRGAIVLFAGAIGGCAVALYNYFVPLTGVTGSGGALLVIVSSALVAAAALVLPALAGRAGRVVLRTLAGLGILGTALAGLLLHEGWLVLAMAIALAGLAIDLAQSRAPARRGVAA